MSRGDPSRIYPIAMRSLLAHVEHIREMMWQPDWVARSKFCVGRAVEHDTSGFNVLLDRCKRHGTALIRAGS